MYSYIQANKQARLTRFVNEHCSLVIESRAATPLQDWAMATLAFFNEKQPIRNPNSQFPNTTPRGT
ncbi:MAG: hypothetical protein M1608_14570, partial [Candidatus Omnitrophica bacterium]|nr:hypothetical protein [Candidatus Omnitrophota bacterium]